SALFGLATWPLGWVMPSTPVLAALIALGLIGRVAQILMKESFRLVPASAVAPFDYTAILCTTIHGYELFCDVARHDPLVGAAIVIAAGLFVIFRERYLARQRLRETLAKPPPPLSAPPDRTP